MPGCERMFARMSSLLSDNLSFPPFFVFFPLLVLVCFHRFLLHHSPLSYLRFDTWEKKKKCSVSMDVCMYGCMYGWMDGCMDGWMDDKMVKVV